MLPLRSHLFVLLTFFFCFLCISGKADAKKDSLQDVWEAEEEADTNRLKAINKLAWEWIRSAPDSTRYWCIKGINSNAVSDHPKWKAVLWNTIGASHYYQSRYDSALSAYRRSVGIFDERTDTSQRSVINGFASAHNNIALIQMRRGKLPQALERFHKSLELRRSMSDSSAIAGSYLNLGELHLKREAYGKALDQFRKSLSMFRKTGSRTDRIKVLNNLGLTVQQAPDSILRANAVDPVMRYVVSLKRFKKVKEGVAGSSYERMYNSSLLNVASSYIKLAQSSKEAISLYGEKNLGRSNELEKIRASLLDSAFHYGQKALTLSRERNGIHSEGNALQLIGHVHFIREEFPEALAVLQNSYRIYDSLSVMNNVRDVSKLLYRTQQAKGAYKKALEWHKVYLQAKDSVMDQEEEKELALQEARYKFEQEQKLKEARHQKQLAIAQREERIQRIFSYSSGAGLFLVLLFAWFLFDRLRLTRKQKSTIQEQKDLVEEKKAEIMASIDYASHIQDALLREESDHSGYMPEHFILFRPKDVVSGDFYWSFEEKSALWFAVADCTGHGVPGAFLTMLGNSYLNEIVSRQDSPNPATVLDELKLRFEREMRNGAKDGMDISILRIEKDQGKFQWAGANNPLYWVREQENAKDLQKDLKVLEKGGHVLIEITPDKRPIGKSDDKEGFSLHEHQYHPGDRFYLFSDGYPDQFGGEKGKKFKYKPFKNFLLSITHARMEEQRSELASRFDEWKGDREQVDDVCVAGLRIQ